MLCLDRSHKEDEVELIHAQKVVQVDNDADDLVGVSCGRNDDRRLPATPCPSSGPSGILFRVENKCGIGVATCVFLLVTNWSKNLTEETKRVFPN